MNKDFSDIEKKTAILKIFTRTLSRIMIIGSILFVIIQIMKTNGEVGVITFIFYAITKFRDSLNDMFRLIGKNYEDSLYIRDFIKFIELENIIKIKENAVRINKKDIPTIEFMNVSFKYPKSDKYVLKSFNLKINAGEKLAIVGENGAGKSTFVNYYLDSMTPKRVRF